MLNRKSFKLIISLVLCFNLIFNNLSLYGETGELYNNHLMENHLHDELSFDIENEESFYSEEYKHTEDCLTEGHLYNEMHENLVEEHEHQPNLDEDGNICVNFNDSDQHEDENYFIFTKIRIIQNFMMPLNL